MKNGFFIVMVNPFVISMVIGPILASLRANYSHYIMSKIVPVVACHKNTQWGLDYLPVSTH